VDVLTLTATPIPRTLSMAMSGIRDMSVLEEAPGDRLPVQSYVLEYDEQIIDEAIKRELRRAGQVFYLCNRIESMPRIIRRLGEAFPEARIVSANGQMDREELSDIWQGMVNADIDILVCTTIIETGVDIPNANTLIIEHADRMGLSQLHQLRGRVGRSSRRAYAYFTYPRSALLSEISEKRLEAIRDFTEFGAGFKIAMRDMEIRGAGNILGADQHGHMESVGYDLYMKLLNEAILEEKGQKREERGECSVSMNLDAYIPERYIELQNYRIEAYKKISQIIEEDDLLDVTDELLDRFGELPQPVDNLLKISYLRALGERVGLSKVEYRQNCVVYHPRKFELSAWNALAVKFNGRILVNVSSSPCVSVRLKSTEDRLKLAISMLKEYIQIIS